MGWVWAGSASYTMVGLAFTSGGGCMLLCSRCSGQGFKTIFLSISQVNGRGLPYSSQQSDGSKCSAVISSTASLSSYLFYYMRASLVQNSGSLSLLLNLDFMHLFGAQTATISHSSFAIPFLLFVPRCELRRSCICNALGVDLCRAAARLVHLRYTLAGRSCTETRHPCAHACHRLYFHALTATQNNVFAI